jgi:formylglycine-generating enzyme required for sulfatase activity
LTFEQWDACVTAGGCSHKPEDRNWGRGKRPVIHVNWYDVQEYVKWLSRRTGKFYRLLSEAEWEYAALGGARSQVFGKGNANANCDGCGSRWDNKQTAPVGSFQPNGFGLHDTLGNVWEWTQDCWKWGYLDAPAGGSAGTSGDCFRRVLRGGSWFVRPRDLRSANRDRLGTTIRGEDVGFRVSRTHP